MRTKISITIWFLFITHFYSQNKNVTFQYIINDRGNKEIYTGMESEFKTKRFFISKNIYKENTFGKELMIKKIDGVWYYKNNNKWFLLYDFNNKKGGFLTFKNICYKIIFNNILNIRGMNFHKISIVEKDKKTTHNPFYYLIYNKGVVIISTGIGKYLIRKDSFDTPLTPQEEELLSSS